MPVETIPHSSAEDIRKVAASIAEHYPTAPIRETEAAIAVLALWTLDALESRRVDPSSADDAISSLEIRIGDDPGPELSDEAHELLLEGHSLHHWGDQWAPDPQHLRQLAFKILATAGDR
jgi:hypothetical protein